MSSIKNEQSLTLKYKRERGELERFQAKLNTKYESIEKKEQRIEELTKEMQQKERLLSRTADAQRAHEQKLKGLYEDLIAKLETISGNESRGSAKSVIRCT